MTGGEATQGQTSIAEGDPADAALMRELRLQRNLKILVGVLGFLILAGLAAVVIRMVGFASGTARVAPATTGSSAAATGAPELGLELPKGARVVSVSVSGNRLAVHHESPEGTGITVIDLDTGRRIAEVKPREALPRN